MKLLSKLMGIMRGETQMENNRSLNLIIPMAGIGKRFLQAGFMTYKPFVIIAGKPMVQYVTDNFPNDVRKFVITCKNYLTQEQEYFLINNLGCKLIYIPVHTEGPAYSIYQAKSKLPLDESFFISYCDINWSWNFESIRKNLCNDGVIYTHTGFHPHLVSNNYSAFCKPYSNNPEYLEVIKEKGSFTDDWMNEPVSIGAFYVRSGHVMMGSIKNVIDNNIRISNEFFPSLLFNNLINNGKKIYLENVDFYIHWGVPEQLEDFNHWCAVICKEKDPCKTNRSHASFNTNIMTMAGLGKRMKGVTNLTKAQIKIFGKPMFEFVAEHFPTRSLALITNPKVAEQLSNYKNEIDIIMLEHQTRSQFETIVHALDRFVKERKFFLTSCDAYGIFNLEKFHKFLDYLKPDAVIFTFKPTLTQEKLSGHHTFVSYEEDIVTAVHFKSRENKSDLGLAGFFWVRSGIDFEEIKNITIEKDVEMSADHIFKYFVISGKRVAKFDLDYYIHLGTPEELQEFNYWNKFISRQQCLNYDISRE